MSLFEGDEYQVKKPRKPRVRYVEQAIKLGPPWVLLRHHAEPPQAHLVISATDVDPGTLRNLQRDGTPRAIPRCQPKKMYAVLQVEGAPLAMLCPKCALYAVKNKIKIEVIERG